MNRLQDTSGGLSETDPANMQVLQTKLLEIESRIESDKGNIDAEFLVHLDKISELEKDKSFHASLIQDHGSRITQLETNVVAINDNNQKLGTRIFNLETYQTADLTKSNKLNNTLARLATDISSNNETLQKQQTRLNELESDISQLIIDLVNTSLTTLEANMSAQILTNQDLRSSITQLETKAAANDVNIQNHDTRISKLENDMTTEQEFSHKMNKTLTQLTMNITANEEEIQAQQIRFHEFESNKSVDHENSLYENMEIRLNYLEDGLNCTWGPWSLFSSCTTTCGAGIHYRERQCNGLTPDFSDHWCSRIETDIQTCNIESCDPEWGEWSQFTECSQSCGSGIQTRNRTCINTSTAECSGNANENRSCNTELCQAPLVDCKDILQNGNGTTDGVYSVILSATGERMQVYCDMTSDGGGWTVFQKRVNGSVDFYKNFYDYENGFGSVYGEFWLGLKYIYQMTKGATNELRLDLEKSTGEKAYAVYQSFSLSGPSNYTLNIGNYSGTAGDGEGLSYSDGRAFTTYDRDVDGTSSGNCGVLDHGGWWYGYCAYANLNGEYVTPGTKSLYRQGEGGVTYRAFDGYLSLKSTEMKFRRKY